MIESEFKRVHVDMLHPDEELPFYKYAALIKSKSQSRKHKGQALRIDSNHKLMACIALLLHNPEVHANTMYKIFGVHNMPLDNAFAAAGGETISRQAFVEKYTDPNFLNGPQVKATPAIVDLLNTIASRIALSSDLEDRSK